MTAASFKAKCLGVLDTVAATGRGVIITKHGKPVARLVPLEPPKSLFGCMADTLLDVAPDDDLLTASPASDWSYDAEDGIYDK